MKYKLNTKLFDEYQIKYNPFTGKSEYPSFTKFIQTDNSFSESIVAWFSVNIRFNATPEGLSFWKPRIIELYNLSKQEQIEKLTELLIGTKFVILKEPCYEI